MMADQRSGSNIFQSLFWHGLLRILIFVFVLYIGTTSAQTNQQQCNDFSGFQEYWSSWYVMYPTYAYRNMYPFGTTFCDSNATVSAKSVGFNPNNNPSYYFKIPFFGSSYRSMWVSPYGFIAFNESTNVQTPPLSYWQPFWPNYNYPHGVDPPFLAPFYASINYMLSSSSQYEPSTISYRMLNPLSTSNTAQQSIMTGMLAQISKNVRSAVPGTHYFAAQYGVVVTYYNVTYQGISCTTGPNLYDTCWRNTFQVALVTDEINTYVVYNYFNITWVGGTDQNCDPSTGLPSPSYPNCVPGQIGFNSGLGRGFTSLPYANTSQESNMDSLSGTNITGTWVYKVSGDYVQHGGCTNESSLASTGRWPLTITPLQGPMFGGNVVNISGPCFLKGMDIKCKFGVQVTNAYYWGNMMQVMCVQPVLYAVGPITLSVSTDGGVNYYFAGTYNVIQQERVPEWGVAVVNSNNNWLNPTSISLTWNPLNLTSEWGNLVTIQLMGYATSSWVILYTFEFEYANGGTYTFTYNSNMCYWQNNHQICAKYMLGAFRVSLSNWQWDPENPMALWSSPVPLGWFAQNQAYWSIGKWWQHDLCNSWYTQDTQSTQWHTNLPACPCTLNQTYVDFGRYQPSTDCNLNNYDLPGSCPYNQGAIACYESTNVSFYGSSSRCCYNKFGNLLYTGDAVNGSVTARSDPWGLAPYNLNPYIPSISHWTNDLLPYYYCCIWESNYYDCFNQFMANRPTMDCKNYQPPGHASVFGDPHINTMDDAQYTFNGWGEYWLLYVPNAQVSGGAVSFFLQARFQQPYNMSWGQTRATVMTAIAAQLNNRTVVSVITNLYNEQERMLIYANSTLLNFTDPNMNWMQFPEFIVIDNDKTKTYSNFTIIFRIGIGINVFWQGGLMQMFATIPPEFMRATNGLFGYWNGNPLNDLVPRGGSSSNAVNPDSDMSNIYYSFGQTWIVQQSETIFTYLYRCSLNYFYYKNTWFLPYFTAQFPPNTTVSQSQVTAVCGSDTNCEYDYMVMQNETVAYDTKMNDQWDTQMRTMGAYVTSCGWLDIPDSIRQMPVSYTVGSQVTIVSCMPGFYWYGSYSQTSFMCQSTGYQSAQWSPNTIPITCAWLNYQPSPPIQAAIAVPICVLGVLAIILLVVCCIRRHKKRKERREDRREKRKNGPAPDSAAAASAANKAVESQAVPLQSITPTQQRTPYPYNNVVAGPLSPGYIDKSMSHTSSKVSLNSNASRISNGQTNNQIQQLNAGSLMRGTTPSNSRPVTPTQQLGSKQVLYVPDPARYQPQKPQSGRTTPTQYAPSHPPPTPPYAYPNNQNIPIAINNGASNYYSRKYAPSNNDTGSEV